MRCLVPSSGRLATLLLLRRFFPFLLLLLLSLLLLLLLLLLLVVVGRALNDLPEDGDQVLDAYQVAVLVIANLPR